jgi:hypothetical protein
MGGEFVRYYAIQEKATGRYVSGTDFSRADGRPHQIFASSIRPPLLFSGDRIGYEIKRRGIDLKRYEVHVVEIRKAESL